MARGLKLEGPLLLGGDPLLQQRGHASLLRWPFTVSGGTVYLTGGDGGEWRTTAVTAVAVARKAPAPGPALAQDGKPWVVAAACE